jgi:hypothetical protein
VRGGFFSVTNVFFMLLLYIQAERLYSELPSPYNVFLNEKNTKIIHAEGCRGGGGGGGAENECVSEKAYE